MPDIPERRLTFSFPDSWQAVSYDADDGFYKNVVQRSPLGLKAVDILALSDDASYFLFEVKDCLGAEDENRPRLDGNDSDELLSTKAWLNDQGWHQQITARRAKPYLPDEVAQKVVDTLTGLVTSIRQSDESLLPFHPILHNPELDVVLFLTLNHSPRDYKRLSMRLADKIRARLNFLNIRHVTVCNEATIPADASWSVRRESV